MHSFFNQTTEVFIGSLVDSDLQKLLTENYASSKKAILVDSNTIEHCLPCVINFIDGLENAEVIEIPAGEENKTMDICYSVWETLSEFEFGRKDVLISLGGGLVSDMGGFIATLYKRGMDFITISTSLLGMVDASIGGKTGVDMGSFKNQLGVFSFPKKVYIDTNFLGTLPKKEWNNGWAEMTKHALIADENHFSDLEKNGFNTSHFAQEWINVSARIKNEIVNSDPNEQGRRKLLNFGHTIGHAIEGSLLHTSDPMDHGLAVAHGMLVEAKLSFSLKFIQVEEFDRIRQFIFNSFDIRVFDITLFEEYVENWFQLMRQDKKKMDSALRLTLLTGIGSADWDVAVEWETVKTSLLELF